MTITPAETAILAAGTPNAVLVLGGLVFNRSWFRRMAKRLDNLDAKFAEHTRTHNDGPRADVWSPFYRRRRTQHE